MTYFPCVGVALQRPPMIDQLRRYEIDTDTREAADLIALQMATRDSVMPVWLGIEEDVPFLSEELFR